MWRALGAGLLVVAVGGCAAVDQTWNDWFGGATPTATPAPAAAQSEVFYAAADGLAMHFLPSGSSQVVGRLALHERVTRLDVQRGYAHVVAENGLEGWVDNAKLLWRLPVGHVPATPGAATPEPLATAAPVPETPTPIAPVPLETAPPVAPVPAPIATDPLAVPSEIYVPKSQRTPTDTPALAPTPTSTPESGLFDPF